MLHTLQRELSPINIEIIIIIIIIVLNRQKLICNVP